MNALAELLREEIARGGPISFHRFMEAALYHPEYGYYRRPHDPFGKHGDFYTAEQLQPVFGILMAARTRALYQEMSSPADFAVVELGAGRAEMATAFAEWSYLPIDLDSGKLPEHFQGVVFSNEFFDALPVHAVTVGPESVRELYVSWQSDRFAWVDGAPASEEIERYVRNWLPAGFSGIAEVNLDALRWLDRIAASLVAGYVLTIDYGYTRREAVRFPAGTLMSYRAHTARENVLENPGEQDITAHVPFTALSEYGAAAGLETVRLETLAQTLLAAGEADQFAAALRADTPAEELRRRLQLKSLLFGMGETFRVLLQRKAGK